VTIINGGFEETNMSSWHTGGNGDHRRTYLWESHHNGGFSMLIGYNYTSPVANSRDYCYQLVTIPSTAKNTTLSFWYHMFTEDYEPYNWFEVYVKDSCGNNLDQVFYKAGTYPNLGLEEFGWEKVAYNLTRYAGQTISLYFAVANNYDYAYKTWCYLDDVMIENEARAEIYYTYTTGGGGGGGGCPYVNTWNGFKYVLNNNLMPSSESSPGDVTDYYLLQQPLVANEEGLYSLLLSEFEEEHSFFDKVQLLAVDHPSNVNIAVSPYGQVLTYSNPHPPVSAITNENRNIKNLLDSVDGNYYQGYNGSYVTLNFGDELDVSHGARLVLRTDMKCCDACLKVQVQNVNGDWKDAATIIPRAYWSTDIIDMSNYLPDARGNLKVRLYFTANHKIDFFGLDTTPQAATTVQEALPASAVHSKNGDPTVYGECMETDVKSKLLYSDDAYAKLMPYEQIKLAFGFSEVPAEGSVRDFIFVTEGHYNKLPVGTLIDPAFYGYWIAPTCYDWHICEVTVDLPSTTTSVMVLIHGRGDFQAYVDNAMLTIIDIKTVTTDKGTLAISYNIISWNQEPGTYGSTVRAIVSLAAYPNASYKIYSMKLQTGQNNQDAKLHIDYAAQENDIGLDVDPAAVEKERYFLCSAVGWTLGIVAGGAVGFFVTTVLGPYAGTEAGAFVVKVFAAGGAEAGTTGLVEFLFQNFAVDPVNTDGGVGYPNAAVWEEWPYPVGPYRDDQNGAFVSVASANYELIWQFNKDYANTFQITTAAWVHWGQVYTYWGGAEHIHQFRELQDAGSTYLSTTFTLSA
jgi:hypothetical protein